MSDEGVLGVLFCGGRGTRLGEITRFVSKSLLPIYDRPVFRFGLKLLETSQEVDSILILTNDQNDEALSQLGYPTLIQDDTLVFDMFTGWEYIKKVTGTKRHGLLVPSDNISDVKVDPLLKALRERNVDLVFSTIRVKDRAKLAQMGCYDPQNGKFHYKHPQPPTDLGVIAPYAIRNSLAAGAGDQVLDHPNSIALPHTGFWFDVGDPDTLLAAANWYAHRRQSGPGA